MWQFMDEHTQSQNSFFLKSTKNPINEMETSLIVFVDHSNAQAMIMYSKHNTNVQQCIRQMIQMKTVITVIIVDVDHL